MEFILLKRNYLKCCGYVWDFHRKCYENILDFVHILYYISITTITYGNEAFEKSFLVDISEPPKFQMLRRSHNGVAPKALR